MGGSAPLRGLDRLGSPGSGSASIREAVVITPLTAHGRLRRAYLRRSLALASGQACRFIAGTNKPHKCRFHPSARRPPRPRRTRSVPIRNGLTVLGPPPNEDGVKKFGRKQQHANQAHLCSVHADSRRAQRAHRQRLGRRRAKNRRRSHHADVAVLDRLQQVPCERSEGAGRHPPGAVQFRV